MCDIWEEFRAALCISGGNRRTPPTLPSADLADGGGEGEVDLLSALPDDVLLSILSRLSSTPAAARTSVLSRRWRRLWAQLPVLWFPLPAEHAREIPSPSDAARTRVRSRRWRRRWARLPALRFQLPAEPARALPSLACARAALAQHSAPALLKLRIVANDADPGDMTAVLRLAAPRLTSELFFSNVVPEDWKDGDVAESGVPVELPCFDRTERILLYLGYLGLVLPRSGVFRKLTFLHLDNFRFHGACDIGDALSSARCPSLRQLRLFDAQGVSDLTICSESILSMCLCNLEGLQQLTIVSPKLRELDICNCFFERQPVADITAPVLKKLIWLDGYDPQSVQLGELAHLRVLGSLFFADCLNMSTIGKW